MKQWNASFVAIVFLIIREVYAVRDAEAEEKCQAFLLSPVASPLNERLDRNLKIDEDAEFFCELVLQDLDLPAQIRVTIHEGLSYLATRHIQMGLQRQKDVYRHVKILAQILPTSFRFNSRAGYWAMDEAVFDIGAAVTFLDQALYRGTRKGEEVTEGARMEVRRNLAKALLLSGNVSAARVELETVIKTTPYDFGIAFLLRNIAEKQGDYASQKLQDLLSPSEDLYAQVMKHAMVEYTGFRIPSSDWTPTEFVKMPSPSTFDTFVQRREPLVIRGRQGVQGEDDPLRHLLGWGTGKWTREYLDAAAGDVLVSVEQRRKLAGQEDERAVEEKMFGFGMDIARTTIPFQDFVRRHFSEDRNELWDEYLNIQVLRDRNKSMWRPPLYAQILRDDIPTPEVLEQYVSSGDMQDVSLWMGKSHESGRDTGSRLHMDATDNLYVLVKGRKTFKLISPDQATKMRTVGPTYGVSPNGFSYQMNPVVFRDLMSNHSAAEGAVPGGEDMDEYGVDEGCVKNYHFSMASNTNSQLLGDAIDKVVTVHLEAGDMLFVPTGWFHQVSSGGGRHMAINYWWRPPNWKDAVSIEHQLQKDLVTRIVKSSRAIDIKSEL